MGEWLPKPNEQEKQKTDENIKKRKSTLEGYISNMMIYGGALGILTFGSLSCEESIVEEEYLFKNNQIAAKRAFERKEGYQLGAAGGVVVVAGGVMLSAYAAGKKKKKE